MIPSKLYIYGAALLTIVLAWGGSMWWSYERGKAADHEAWQTSITADAVAQANRVQASSIVTTQVVTQYVDRVHVVLSQGATITKEIPIYVTAKANAQCTLTAGFAGVLNEASGGQGLDANPTTGAYDAALGTSLSDATSVIAGNLIQCRADQERLRSLQGWVTSQQKIANDNGAH